MGGQLGHEDGVGAIVGQRDGNVGLAAAEGELEVVGLNETLIVVGLQADHQFAEGYDFHSFVLL